MKKTICKELKVEIKRTNEKHQLINLSYVLAFSHFNFL